MPNQVFCLTKIILCTHVEILLFLDMTVCVSTVLREIAPGDFFVECYLHRKGAFVFRKSAILVFNALIVVSENIWFEIHDKSKSRAKVRLKWRNHDRDTYFDIIAHGKKNIK